MPDVAVPDDERVAGGVGSRRVRAYSVLQSKRSTRDHAKPRPMLGRHLQ
jgi:hypothetical protein